ncbi:SpoIIE family protein phosphatase [Candidatus Uabimicrobium amorphum]|uniref:Sigma factor sigB regulation protein rsbU n=2 Tax=Uabimicrobium amorphum TaxID=2596890 RepID=A0A5S9ITB5_UABAM|nr:sigma factor sigB regulation protein rsbU [Candidatus Uabimicrobium amorphum]
MSFMEEIHYDQVFKYHHTAQFITDSKGKIIHTNQKFEQITGYSLEEVQGRSIDAFFYKQDKKRLFLFHNKKNTLGNVSFTQEIQINTKKDGPKEVKIWFNIHQEKGYKVCAVEDASEKAELLEKVHNEKKKLETILTYLGDGVIVCNPQNQITLISKKAMEFLDLRTSHGVVMSHEGIIGQNIKICFPEDLYTKISADIENFTTHPEALCRCKLENNNFVLQITYSPIFTAHDEFVGIAFLLHDITKEIEAEKFRVEAMQKEVEIAKRIQTTLLPPEEVLADAKEYFDISAQMIPSDEVGGDYYDFIFSKNGRYWFTIGDVSGHGLTSGLIMMMAQVAVMTTTVLSPDISPRDMYSKLNTVLYTNIRERMQKSHYMTLSLLVSNQQGDFHYVGAHIDLIVYRDKQKKCELLQTEGVWLGIIPDIEGTTKEQTFHLDKNDVLVLITDGIIEVQNAQGEMYDIDRLVALIENNAQLEVTDLRNLILQDVANFTLEPQDDMSLMVIRKF